MSVAPFPTTHPACLIESYAAHARDACAILAVENWPGRLERHGTQEQSPGQLLTQRREKRICNLRDLRRDI